MSVLNYLIERKQKVAKQGRVLLFHGTTNKFLKSILSNGLITNTKEKVWATDPDSHFDIISRQSYGGIYLTNNLITSISSARNAVNKLGGTAPIIIVAQIQPRSTIPDEDNFQSYIEYSLKYAVGGGGKYNPNEYSFIMAYGDYLKNNEEYKKAIQFFTIRLLEYFCKDKNELKNACENNIELKKYIVNLYNSALLRKIPYIDDYKLKSGLSRHIHFQHDDLNQYIIKDKNKAEQDYMDAVNRIIKLFKHQAYDTNNYNYTTRIMEPIGFSGVNKIISIIEITNYLDSDSKIMNIVVHYGDLPKEFMDQFNKRLGYKYEVEYRNRR